MSVVNVHERTVDRPIADVAPLLDGLASSDDRLWPRDAWPAMRFDRPLGVGADGGHGPIRYVVEAYEPGARVRFRFTGPAGFDGHHELRLIAASPSQTVLHHEIRMRVHGAARLTWPLVFAPLHDALIEDAFDRAERALGIARPRARWSPWVRLLRLALGPRRRRPRARGGAP